MLPFEKQMKFSHFLHKLEFSSHDSAIHYVQKQNSNMTTEFKSLMEDVDRELPWATEIFGRLHVSGFQNHFGVVSSSTLIVLSF